MYLINLSFSLICVIIIMNNDNFINEFLKIHFNMSKKCSIYLKSPVLLQNIIIIIF